MVKPLPLDALRITIPGGHQLFRSTSPISVRLKLRELGDTNAELWVTDSMGNKLRIQPGPVVELFRSPYAPSLSPSMQKVVDVLIQERDTE